MWNYRVVRKKNIYIDSANKKERVDYTYAIHEAYYDEDGHAGAITQEPVAGRALWRECRRAKAFMGDDGRGIRSACP